MSTVSVIVRVQLSQESAPKYAEAAKAVVESTRQEEGCQWYGIAADVTDPCVVWVSEQWASQAALDAHLKTPHVSAFLQACAGLVILDMVEGPAAAGREGVPILHALPVLPE